MPWTSCVFLTIMEKSGLLAALYYNKRWRCPTVVLIQPVFMLNQVVCLAAGAEKCDKYGQRILCERSWKFVFFRRRESMKIFYSQKILFNKIFFESKDFLIKHSC